MYIEFDKKDVNIITPLEVGKEYKLKAEIITQGEQNIYIEFSRVVIKNIDFNNEKIKIKLDLLAKNNN